MTDIPTSIVAVHGLYQDQTETWTDRTAGVFWLRDFLSKQIPDARVLTYGYKAEILSTSGESSSDRILPHALTLIADLHADRQLADAISRPIIFICHGMGGILVKRALAFSNTSVSKQVEHRRSIFISTYAIMFFGTPHFGMDDAALRAMTQISPDRPLSQFSSAMTKGSQLLQEINDQFAPLTKRFSMYFFWEQVESDLGSTKGFIVGEESAAPAWENVERSGIAANHSNMCKFSSQEQDGYKILLSACQRYTRAAPSTIRNRWRRDRSLLDQERKQEALELVRHDSAISDSAPSSRPANEYFVVPQSASSMFTGREDIAQMVRQKIVLTPISKEKGHQQHKIFVIWGLGGSGKTQFCLKFVEDHREE